MWTKLRTLSLAAGVTLFSSMALAGPATDAVKARQTALAELVKANDSKKLAKAFDDLLDYGALAEASLGSEWSGRSDAEKAEFSDLLKQLVRKSYERNLKKTLGYTVEYVSEEAADSKVWVKTRAVGSNKKEEPVEVDYKMAEKDGAWRVQDIKTEGVSLVGSYRNQFVKIIKKDGFPALIKKMKDKLAKGDT